MHDYYKARATKGTSRSDVRQIMPEADENMIVYHFGFYECESKQASRATGER